ncbi:MAG: hypothetical protein Q9169_005845 [Polycauliona sp. 2 TL-2023]
MLLSQSREVVAAGYRVTRHAITDRRSLQTIRRLNTDELVMLSLVKESKANIEREQALKFVRAFLDVKGGIHEISNIVLRTIVAIAEHHEDRLRNISILTLLELLVRSPAKVVDAGGMASLTQALLDGSYPGSESLASAILFLFDKPNDRLYLKSCHELDAAFTVFTDPLVVHGSEEKLKASASVIIALLQSWPGLYSVSNDGFAAIKGLLLSLAYPSLLARDLILDIVNAVLQIKAPSWSSAFLAGRRLTTYGRVANLNKEAPRSSTVIAPEDEEESRISLNEHYLALLLAVLIQSGLPQVLSKLIQEEAAESGLRRKATLLHGEMLNLANRLLPQRYSASLQVFSQLVDPDDFRSAKMSLHQISMTYQVDSVSRTLHRSRAASQRPFDAMVRSKQQSTSLTFHSNKHQVDYDMDEIKFRAAIVETQVLNHANFLKWDWNLIEELIESPLRNPRRLNEAINGTKFLKRLLGFYRPFKYRFSAALNTKLNQRYIRAGVSMMKVLLQSNEGIAYLRDSKFLRQLGECLSQIDRTSGFFADEPLFSHWRTSSTLTGGYFSLLGALSSDPKGLQMFERWHMVNISYHILDLRDRDDLVELLLGNMDFTLRDDVVARRLLEQHIRIFATNLLRKYAVQAPHSETDSQSRSGVCEWAIRLLVTQLYDPEVEVSEVAVQILEESCQWRSHLEYVVRCRPQLDHLNNIGAPLLLRFLSTSLGYQYLDRLDYITQEMDDWFLGRNNSYVTLVEAILNRGFSASLNGTLQSHTHEPPLSPRHPALPPHFYRELSRTKEGCVLLQDSGHFDQFVTTIHDTWTEHEDQEAIIKLKGCLWAVGNIGSMELGASFLDNSDVVKWIVEIAEHSEVATLRGTALFVLGLISRSLHGMEIITEHGWLTATDYYGRSIGYCLPSSLGVFFSIGNRPRLAENGSYNNRSRGGPPQPVADKDPIHARILESVANTGNTVLTKKAAGELNTLKTHHLEAFSSVELYRKVRDMLGRYKFHLPVRRFVLDLFNRSVVREIVLDEDESERLSSMAASPSAADRVRGSLYGVAVCDALGGPVEFCWRGSFDPVTTMRYNSTFDLPPGSWTDDTSMTLCLAQSLVEKDGEFSSQDQVEKYIQWLEEGYMSSTGECFDIGNATRNALHTWTEELSKRGSATEKAENGQRAIDLALKRQNQCGNGSLMRVSPIGLVFNKDVEKAMEYAAASSQVTHPYPTNAEACKLYTKLIASTFQNITKPELAAIVTNFSFQDPDLKDRFAKYITFEAWQDVPEDQISSSGYVVHSLEASLWAFFTTTAFDEGALKVVNLGDDADTVGAIYGGLAGAFYGVEAIASKWLNGIKKKRTVDNVVEGVADLVQRG